MRKFEKAVHDWPKSRYLGKEKGFEITGPYLSADDIAGRDKTVSVIWIVGLIAAVFTAGASLVLALVVHLLVVAFGGSNIKIQILPDAIRIWENWQYKNFERAFAHQFALEEHEKGREEQIKEAQTGKEQKVIYRESVEVVMWYGERRISLAGFCFGREGKPEYMQKARALQHRLQLIDKTVEDLIAAAERQNQPEGAELDDGFFGPDKEIR